MSLIASYSPEALWKRTIILLNNLFQQKPELKTSPKSFNANNNNINQVVTFIKSEYSEWLEGRYKKQNLININSLSRENLTKKLFDIITKLK